MLKNRQPILINTSRGAVVDNPALLKAIDGEWLGGVVLDVWENEPNISPELLEVVDLATPHIAGYSFDGKVNGTQMIYEALCGSFGIKATGWKPTLPPPPIPAIELTVSSGEDDEEVLRRVVRRLYDITADDTALRKNILATSTNCAPNTRFVVSSSIRGWCCMVQREHCVRNSPRSGSKWIDDIRARAPLQHRQQIFRRHDRHASPRFHGRAAEVRE